MPSMKKPLTSFGEKVMVYSVRNQVECQEIDKLAGISRVALSEVMHGKRSGTRKVIPAARKVMRANGKINDSISR